MAECPRPRKLHGYCSSHARKNLLYGDPRLSMRACSPRGIQPWDAFWLKAVVLDGCWAWKGGHNALGYAQFNGGPGRTKAAHRWLWEQLNVRLPRCLVLDHLCRNPSCINPDHLEPVTNAENVRRGVPRNQNMNKQICNAGHPFTPENTYTYSDGRRLCRECGRAASRETKRRKRLATNH